MTREQLAAALRKADAAGNTEDARRLAGAIRSLDAVPQPMPQQTNPMVAMGQRAQQEYAQAGSPALPPSATIAPAPSQDPLMPRGGWTPEQQAQQQLRNSDPNDPFRVGGARQPAPASTSQPQNWNDQIAGWISENLTPIAEKAGASVGGMIGGQRQGAEVAADIGKGVGGGLSEWGATAFRDPVSAANQAIETLDPAHQFAYAYNDANDAAKAAATGDWEQVGKELKDLSLSGSFAAMSVLPGNMTYKGIQQATGKAAMAPSIASQVFKAGPTATDRAADILIKKMKADGLTLDDLQKVQRSLANRGDSGVYETFSELAGLSDKSSGANLRGLAMALGSVPGPAQEAIIARVAANAEALPKRTSRAASRATGQDASKAAATLDELEKRLKTESGPLYQRFYDAPVEQQIYDAQIAPVLNAPHGQAAMERAARGLGVEAASLQARNASGDVAANPALQRTYDAAMALKNTLEGKATGPLPPLALDHVKRAFDDLIDEAGQGTYTGGNLRSAKRNFAESVSRATGGTYGDALGFYEGGKRLEEAFDIGLNALKQPTWQLERAMKAGNRGSPFSAGEVEAIAMGVARHIEDLIEANDQAALTKLLKGKALKNLSTALGDPRAAAKFEQSIQRLAANREWGRRVSGGSDTAMRQAAIDDASRLEEDPVTRTLERAKTATAPPSLFGAAYSAVAKPVAEAAQDAYRRMKYPGIRDEAVNAAIAPMMANAMSRGNLDEIATAIEARLARKNPKQLPPPGGGAAALNGPKGSPVLPPPSSPPVKAGTDGTKLNGMGGAPEGIGAAGGATYGYLANPTDANGDGVIDDQDRGLNAMGGLVSGGILAHGGRRAVGAVGNALKGGVASRALEPLELSKANRVYAPGKPDDLGFITSAEYVLANPPARFRDAKALTADQWRKLMREGGASGESFKWQIEPALKRLADEGVTGDIPKVRFEEALARTRGTLDRVGIRQLGDIGFESQRMRERRLADDIGIAIGQNRTREVERLRAKQQEMQQSYEAKYDEYVAPGKSSNYQQHVLTLPESQGQGYKSHNWNTKNPVGHVRTTNRTSANGEKVLHVEELQSDLHQEAAKYGYRGEAAPPDAKQLRAASQLQKAAESKYQAWADANPTGDLPYVGFSENLVNQIADPVGRELYREAIRAKNTYHSLINAQKLPPKAPLENWEEPFIRYALKQGADQGVDVITFPTWDTLHSLVRNEGTQKFYDGRLPNHLANVAKSLGLKVERVDMPIAPVMSGHFSAQPIGSQFGVVNDKIGEWHFSAGRFDTLEGAQQAARKMNKRIHSMPAIRLTPEAKQRLSEGIIMDAKDPGRRAPAKRPPPAQAGFLQFTSDASSGIGDALVDAYGNLKRGMFANDPRQLNEVAEALKGMSPSSRALVDFNARRDIPQSVIAAADTPPELAELIGRATSQNPGGPDKLIDAQAKQYQTRLADQIMGEQRAERDLINMDKKAGPIGALEKEILSSYNWTPAREVQQDVALADLIAEGMKPGGGIPQNAGALDRFREGVSRGAQQPPMMMSPRDEDMLAKLIFDPAMAKNANDLLANPVKPWVSEAERKAIQIGVPATGLAAMIAGGSSLYNQPGGQADVEQPVPGSSPERPVYTVSDRLMPTNNPAEPPPELNGLNTDTRTRAQQRLMALGYAPMKLPSGVRFDDGIDGPMLRRSVEVFQRENGLPPTGDLDPMTLRALWGGKNYGISPTMRAYGEELAPAPQ